MQNVSTEIEDINGFVSTILSNIYAAVIIVDRNLEIKAQNKAYTENLSDQLFGNENVGQVISCVYEFNNPSQCGNLPQCNICEIKTALIYVIEHKLSQKQQYFSRRVKQDGIEVNRSYSFSAHPIIYMGEEMAMLIIEDVTDRKQQKEVLELKNKQLEAINAQKNRFLSIASHDLRNPIAAIQACSNLLLSSLDGQVDEDQRNLLDIIFTKSQYSLNLISDLLDYSKIEAGKLNLYLQKEDLNTFINYIFQNYTILARNSKIKLALNIPEPLPEISIDRNRIEQVINNLIDNAIKYSLIDDTITVSCHYDDQYISIAVEDEGPGIPEDELNKIFNAFHKVETSFHSKRNGSGLGLAIVKKIIDAHNGKIEVESVFEQGSKFTVKLPLN